MVKSKFMLGVRARLFGISWERIAKSIGDALRNFLGSRSCPSHTPTYSTGFFSNVLQYISSGLRTGIGLWIIFFHRDLWVAINFHEIGKKKIGGTGHKKEQHCALWAIANLSLVVCKRTQRIFTRILDIFLATAPNAIKFPMKSTL